MFILCRVISNRSNSTSHFPQEYNLQIKISFNSGSLTDSICTTYENKQKTVKTPTKIPVKNQIDEVQSGSLGSIKESPYTPVSNLTSMLGGK